MGDVSHALPARLSGAGWRSLFVHPHDLRFYNRDRIMAAAGFKDLIGEEHFARPVTREGRYVPDIAIADKIIEMASDAEKATLIYAVTIENHGPWEPGTSEVNLADSYLHLVRKGDAMLQKLIDELAHLKRPATLAFFGDHRPSIPGISVPGGPRHTPYIVIRIDANGNIVRGGRRLDLQPDELHHLLLGLWSGEHEASAGLG
jgi:phosphoglycerol transferase MdoB-like AlkP superfamily enzyme